jgi:hypothetical protein
MPTTFKSHARAAENKALSIRRTSKVTLADLYGLQIEVDCFQKAYVDFATPDKSQRDLRMEFLAF